MTDAPVRVALVGMGRMGRALDALAPERGIEIVARLDALEMQRGLTRDDLQGAQVAIEFTQPECAIDNAVACLALGCPVVIGTTGWGGPAQRSALGADIDRFRCAALWAPNFSLGVQLFLALVEDAARRLRGVSAFDTHVIETHHAAKRDAPSGTAIALAERIASGLGHTVPVTSVRVGSVPGTHEVVFDAPFEQIRLTHDARDRRVFADGALAAAQWLAVGRPPALYSLQDVLSLPLAAPAHLDHGTPR